VEEGPGLVQRTLAARAAELRAQLRRNRRHESVKLIHVEEALPLSAAQMRMLRARRSRLGHKRLAR
jgi:hypothetical protein